jgi:membrane protease YdiL (CAAX protease family)
MVGLALGAAMCWTRSLALCIGLHAGLNLAAGGT